jgi:NAD(P)H-dependent nitrite reductase small subunit
LTSAGEAERLFVRVTDRRSISQNAATVVNVGRYEVAIFDIAGELYAYENCCPHQGGPIGEGIIEGTTVTCPWHAWCFDLLDGRLTLGDFAKLRRFEVRVQDDAVYIATEPSNES